MLSGVHQKPEIVPISNRDRPRHNLSDLSGRKPFPTRLDRPAAVSSDLMETKVRGLVLLLTLSFLFSLACQEEKETIKDYGKTLMTAAERAKVTVDLSKIRLALELYRIQHDGKYPPSLKNLELDLHYPGEYTYDPKTGKVKSKQYPRL